MQVREIEKARAQLTTFGLFGQQSDVHYDVPGYDGISDQDEEQEPKEDDNPDVLKKIPLMKGPMSTIDQEKKNTQIIESFFMDNFQTIM